MFLQYQFCSGFSLLVPVEGDSQEECYYCIDDYVNKVGGVVNGRVDIEFIKLECEAVVYQNRLADLNQPEKRD